MKSPAEITHIFTKFAGRQVRMKEKRRDHSSLEGRIVSHESGPQFFKPYTRLRPDWTDPTLLRMLFTAKSNGLRLFLSYPSHELPRHDLWKPYRPRADRLLVDVQRGSDGKWRVAGCRIG
jgi:hypothetical protein